MTDESPSIQESDTINTCENQSFHTYLRSTLNVAHYNRVK